MVGKPPTPPIVAPSILSADFSRLPAALAIVDPSRDWIHCDVMDQHFVPNLTFGPIIVSAVHKLTRAFVDVHLMIERPETLAPAFRKAGADQITVHLEACRSPEIPLARFDPLQVEPARVRSALAAVRATGARAGLALKPATPLAAAVPFLSEIDVLLVMTVEPGFGGQAFMTDMLPKVREADAWRREHGAAWLIEVDGGIADDTAPVCREAGADVFVAGQAIFGSDRPLGSLTRLREVVETTRG